MGDLDDGPEQRPLSDEVVQKTILDLLPCRQFDFIITHRSAGEYTRHLRHEQTAGAVFKLWNLGRLRASQLWSFAYEDGAGSYLPRPDKSADLRIKLPKEIWQRKYEIITDVYGFTKDSFEAGTTPKIEAFRRLEDRC
jgi:hypothetical protein